MEHFLTNKKHPLHSGLRQTTRIDPSPNESDSRRAWERIRTIVRRARARIDKTRVSAKIHLTFTTHRECPTRRFLSQGAQVFTSLVLSRSSNGGFSVTVRAKLCLRVWVNSRKHWIQTSTTTTTSSSLNGMASRFARWRKKTKNTFSDVTQEKCNWAELEVLSTEKVCSGMCLCGLHECRNVVGRSV